MPLATSTTGIISFKIFIYYFEEILSRINRYLLVVGAFTFSRNLFLDIYCEEEGIDKMGEYEKERYESFQNKYDNEIVDDLSNDVELVIINHSK